MRSPWAALAAAVVLAGGAGGRVQAQSTDEAGVRSVADSYAAAWAKGDAKAIAALYDSNGTHIHSSGATQRDPAAVEKYYTEALAGPLKGTRIAIVTGPVRFVKPDVAVTDGSWEVSGVRGPDGREAPPLKGLFGNVLVKKGGRWLLSAITALEPVGGGAPPQ